MRVEKIFCLHCGAVEQSACCSVGMKKVLNVRYECSKLLEKLLRNMRNQKLKSTCMFISNIYKKYHETLRHASVFSS